jgi:hypothetical protein
VRPAFGSPFLRGAVSGIGLITVLAGLVELAALFAARRARSFTTGPTGITEE